MNKIAIYPGTFDPITVGHTDIIKRALQVVNKLIIAVADDSNSNKTPIFNVTKRVELVKNEVEKLEMSDKVIVETFKGLLVDFAKQKQAKIIIRGLRAVSDFEYEFKMSCMNQRMHGDISTIFLPASEETQFISSALVKQIAQLGGNLQSFVSDDIKLELQKYFASTNKKL